MEIIERHFSVEKIRKYFQSRPALGAPDVDGWRGREHIARLLTKKDSDFHLLFRKHLILPFLHDHFEPRYAPENAGGHLGEKSSDPHEPHALTGSRLTPSRPTKLRPTNPFDFYSTSDQL